MGHPAAAAGAPHHLCLGVSDPSPHPTRMGARSSISGHTRKASPRPPIPGRTGASTPGGPGNLPEVEGRAMCPPRGLHSPHPDDTPGGQSNRPAGIWVAGAPGLPPACVWDQGAWRTRRWKDGAGCTCLLSARGGLHTLGKSRPPRAAKAPSMVTSRGAGGEGPAFAPSPSARDVTADLRVQLLVSEVYSHRTASSLSSRE